MRQGCQLRVTTRLEFAPDLVHAALVKRLR